MNKKFICLSIIVLSVIFNVSKQSSLIINAMENEKMPRSKFNECLCPKRDGHLKESVENLRQSGDLTEEDIKNIDCYMKKQRDLREQEIKEKMYNAECENIDNMVREKVISKEKGKKLKLKIKPHMNEINKHIK